MVEIQEVRTRRQRAQFAKFPIRMYRDCPYYIPDLISDEIDNFNPKKNPAYDYCEARCFLAKRDGKIVGRVAAIVSRAANEKWNTRRIRFSRLDFIDDLEVSSALLKAVEQWGRELGMDQIHGPIGFCDLDQEGMLVEGFDRPSLFFTIYNYPYYTDHMKALGYEKDVDWVEYLLTVPKEVDPRVQRLSDVVLKRYKLTLLTPKSRREIRPYVLPVLEIINQAYSELYGTVELSQRHLEKYYKQFILLINPQYLRILVDRDQKPVGFGLALPSLNTAVKKSGGRLFPFGWYRVLRAPFQKSRVLDLYLIGVLPHMRGKGLTAVLMDSLTRTAIENGVEVAETGPELETNEQVQAMWKNYEAEQHKRRRCWKKAL